MKINLNINYYINNSNYYLVRTSSEIIATHDFIYKEIIRECYIDYGCKICGIILTIDLEHNELWFDTDDFWSDPFPPPNNFTCDNFIIKNIIG